MDIGYFGCVFWFHLSHIISTNFQNIPYRRRMIRFSQARTEEASVSLVVPLVYHSTSTTDSLYFDHLK